jgi:cell division protein FtsB
MQYFFSHLSSIWTAITAFLTGSSLVAFFGYLGMRGRNMSTARRTDAQTQKIEWDGWKGYAEKLEARMDTLEQRYEAKITELERLLDNKDKEIRVLQDKNIVQEDEIRTLRHNVADLQHANQIFDDEHSTVPAAFVAPLDHVIIESK